MRRPPSPATLPASSRSIPTTWAQRPRTRRFRWWIWALPQAIVGAFQGGGSVAQSVAGTAGAQIGANLVKNFGKSITDTLGKTFGGAINAILPGLGSLAAPLIGLVGKLFGKSEES